MIHHRRMIRGAAAFLIFCSLSPTTAGAADFPPITDAQRALDGVAGEPGMPAVVLFKNGRLQLIGTRGQETYSSLRVETRIKVLTEQGEKYAEVEVPHSEFIRLVTFEGRTVLPDGTVVELPDDAVFQRTVSGQKKWYVSTAAFPAVEPGAILDVRYELRFESIYMLEPWYFQEPIPVLHSEIVYSIPSDLAGRAWGQSTVSQEIQTATQKTARGTELTAWMDDLPGYLEETASFPAADLSSRFMVVPTRIPGLLLLEDWKSASNLIDYTYKELRRNKGAVQRRGRQLAKAAGGEKIDQARTIYEFVRDEIDTLPLPGVYATSARSLDAVLADARGTYAEKGLVLEAMLDAARLRPQLIWAPERSDGSVDLSVANPNWFERVLVRLELDGEEIYLDPSGESYPFGYVGWEVEGMPAVVYDTGRPDLVELPVAPFDSHRRSARVELEIGDDGALAGRGTLVATGHHAVSYRSSSGDDPQERRDWWRESLEEDYPGFALSEVTVDTDPVTGRLTVGWSLEQEADEVLGDEVEILPSRPLGPVAQRFLVQPSSRYAPVLLPFADRDEVEVTVRWPEGWVIDVVPEATETTTDAGTYELRLEPGEDGRSLTVHRRFDTVAKTFVGRDAYRALRDLYGAVTVGDDQPLVLIHE